MAYTGKVGFIGLGLMGGAMAANLLKGGVDLTVFDISPVAVEALRAKTERAGVSIAVPKDKVAAAVAAATRG